VRILPGQGWLSQGWLRRPFALDRSWRFPWEQLCAPGIGPLRPRPHPHCPSKSGAWKQWATREQRAQRPDFSCDSDPATLNPVSAAEAQVG